MRLKGLPIIAFGLVLLPSVGAAAAESLPIAGAWGNADGCRYHRDGSIDGDGLKLVTPKEITAYGGGCEIVQVLTASDGTHVVTGSCSYEGEDVRGVEHFAVRTGDATPPTLLIYNSDGSLWEEVAQCP